MYEGLATDDQSVRAPAGGDRFRERRRVFGSMSIDRKVSASDTNGGFFVIENTDARKGGPPRHYHHRQEERFHVIDSEYSIEIGDEHHQLGPGDSVLAPRIVPRVWARAGEGGGRLIVAFQPAGQMEACFGASGNAKGTPAREELQILFGSRGTPSARTTPTDPMACPGPGTQGCR